MRGNFQVRFLGEGVAVMSLPYPTYPDTSERQLRTRCEHGISTCWMTEWLGEKKTTRPGNTCAALVVSTRLFCYPALAVIYASIGSH